MKRFLLPVVFCAFALGSLTGCSGGNSKPSPSASTATTAPTPQSLVSLLPLRTSDLPQGFAAVDVISVGVSPLTSSCVPALATAAATQPGQSFLSSSNVISSQSYVLLSTPFAVAAMAAVADPAVNACLSTLLQDDFVAYRTRVGLADLPLVPSFVALDGAAAAFRISMTDTSNGGTRAAGGETLLVVQTGPSVSVAWVRWKDGFPSEALERSIVTALRARATAALPG